MQHSLALADAAVDRPPVTVPVPRAAGPLSFGSDGEVAWVPAVLLLAASGRCSCETCVTEYVRAKGRQRLRVV